MKTPRAVLRQKSKPHARHRRDRRAQELRAAGRCAWRAFRCWRWRQLRKELGRMWRHDGEFPGRNGRNRRYPANVLAWLN